MDGILLIDKPLLYSSHDVVDVVRRKLNQRKVGHGGTLDPMATGLLVILLGKATKQFERISSADKVYSGIMTLGMQTDTLDAEGKIVSEAPADHVNHEILKKVFNGMQGDMEQVVPEYSSAKRNGKKYYQYARKNIALTPLVKKITINVIKLLAYRAPDVHFYAHVSKGTYVRALAKTIGQEVKSCMYLSALRRMASGNFSIKNALTIESLKKLSINELGERASFLQSSLN